LARFATAAPGVLTAELDAEAGPVVVGEPVVRGVVRVVERVTLAVGSAVVEVMFALELDVETTVTVDEGTEDVDVLV